MIEITHEELDPVAIKFFMRGHDMQVINDWSPSMGSLSGIVVDGESGVLKGGADPRRDTYAIGR